MGIITNALSWVARTASRFDARPSPQTTALVGPVANTSASASRFDGWANLATGMGTHADRVSHGTFAADRLPYHLAEQLWTGEAIMARIIERPVDDAIREGYRVLTRDAGLDNDLRGMLNELDVDVHLQRGWYYERAYGFGCNFIVANDGQPLTAPLLKDRLTAVHAINTFDWSEVFGYAADWDSDITSRHYNTPRTYQIRGVMGGTAVVHRSRLLLFPGIFANNRQHLAGAGRGFSTLDRVFQTANRFNQMWGNSANLTTDFAQGVLTIPGLEDLIASNDQSVMQRRLAALDLLRSTMRMMVLAGKSGSNEAETFERKTTPITGLPELLDKAAILLSAAADIPVTLLFGQSPAGLNATGDSDVRQYYDRVRALQRAKLRPRILYLSAICAHVLTGGRFKGELDVQFNSLWQPTELEKADLRLKVSQADEIEIRNDVITPEEARESHHGGEEWSPHIKLADPPDALPSLVETAGVPLGERAPGTPEPLTQMDPSSVQGRPGNGRVTPTGGAFPVYG